MRIGIIGLGALGASLGLALRAAKGWEDVTGYDTSARVQNEAKRRGAIREGTRDVADLLSDAEVVVLAVPPLAVTRVLSEFGATLRPGTVITDVATTKQAILEAADRNVPAGSGFVGGHPLVNAAPGIEHADAALFRGRSWRLATSAGTTEAHVGTVSAIVEVAGAIPYFVDPAEHDAWVAGVEQLPTIMAAALSNLAGASDAWRELVRTSGQPFDDATRWAATRPEEGRDLALTNGVALVSWLDRLLSELADWREAIAESRGEALLQQFASARALRERWETERAGETPRK